jgi:crotonobetainyl-CoA:carnitine CoA-transferase CaiB-like acyl-CoA transferase
MPDDQILAAVRVLDWTTMAAGPGAAAVLADFGASVTKVEMPGGDPWRKVLLNHQPEREFGTCFEQDNRGKRSVVLDLACDAGRHAFHLLLAASDVLVCNIRQAGTQRLGLDYESLRARYPRLVYAHVTAWGREGPMRDAPGYDAGAYWAATGMMDVLRAADDAPLPRLPGAAGDHATSMSLVAGIALGLFHRERSGAGKLVDVSLLRSGLWANGMYLSFAAAAPAEASARVLRDPHRIGATFRAYRCRDGESVHLLGYQARHLCDVM